MFTKGSFTHPAHHQQCPLDKPAEKLMAQFAGKFSKQYNKGLEELDEQGFTGDPDILALYEFVGVAVPGNEANRQASPSKHKSQVLADGTPKQTRYGLMAAGLTMADS
jgi:hypothetical protein